MKVQAFLFSCLLGISSVGYSQNFFWDSPIRSYQDIGVMRNLCSGVFDVRVVFYHGELVLRVNNKARLSGSLDFGRAGKSSISGTCQVESANRANLTIQVRDSDGEVRRMTGRARLDRRGGLEIRGTFLENGVRYSWIATRRDN